MLFQSGHSSICWICLVENAEREGRASQLSSNSSKHACRHVGMLQVRCSNPEECMLLLLLLCGAAADETADIVLVVQKAHTE